MERPLSGIATETNAPIPPSYFFQTKQKINGFHRCANENNHSKKSSISPEIRTDDLFLSNATRGRGPGNPLSYVSTPFPNTSSINLVHYISYHTHVLVGLFGDEIPNGGGGIEQDLRGPGWHRGREERQPMPTVHIRESG